MAIACDIACAIPFIPGTAAFNSCVACCIKTGLGPALQTPSICAGGSNVACTNTHSAKTQGPGICCQALSSGALQVPPPGTTLSPYTPGSAAQLMAQGRATTVTDSAGHCGTCMIVGSTSRKHPGKPALKFIRGGPSCPSSATGCCALVAAGGV